MKNILKQGINSNVLKTIAVIAMVIDHIGFYFSFTLPTPIYIACRYIGRIAMPIFVYLLVQGFFHTKNFKKYVFRVGLFAIITQILIIVMIIINKTYMPDYDSAKQVWYCGNILFPFVLSLITLKLLHSDVIIKKWTYYKNLSLKIALIVGIFLISVFVPMDYGIEVLVLSTLLYYLEKFRINILMQRNGGNISINKLILNNISENKIRIVYLAIILLILTMLVVYYDAIWTVIFAIIPISLYNGERGRKKLKYTYYIIFTLQHILLYAIAMSIMLT